MPRSLETFVSSSVKGTAVTSDVVLSIEIVSFPVGGTMTRIAWGMMIRLRISRGDMPRACAASSWPLSTESSPDRTISAR